MNLIGEQVPLRIREADNFLPSEVVLHKASGMSTEELTLRECLRCAPGRQGNRMRGV